LEENTLVFIRDRDIHYYEQATENDCQFINLSFYKEVIDSLFNFLGEGFPQSSLLSPEMPPVVILSILEKEYVQHRLERLNMISSTKKSLIKAEVRALLIELFSRYIMESYPVFTLEQPEWLHDVCRAMEEKDNFVEGIPALIRISQKTHSHLCRVFKKHLATTPIDYINSLRMSYAENLLLNTDMDILNICLETGFENISYFYELFKCYFKMTPHKFRKSKKQHL
jgi:AraC family cel operon transcriptional repressor